MKYIIILLFSCSVILLTSCLAMEHSQAGIGGSLERAKAKTTDTLPICLEARWSRRMGEVSEIHIDCFHAKNNIIDQRRFQLENENIK